MNAIEQAIEALELAQRFIAKSAYPEAYDKCTDAITALQSMQGEAVAHLTWHQGRVAADDYVDYLVVAEEGDKSDDGTPAFPVYTHPKIPAVADGYVTVEINQLETLKGLLNAMSAFTAESMVAAMLTASGKGE